jgi:hypothetical protein
MDNFYKRITEMPNEQRKAILNNLIMQLRQQNQHPIADAFFGILSCYPDFPLFKNEKNLMLMFAWNNFFKLERNPVVQQIVNQPI